MTTPQRCGMCGGRHSCQERRVLGELRTALTEFLNAGHDERDGRCRVGCLRCRRLKRLRAVQRQVDELIAG